MLTAIIRRLLGRPRRRRPESTSSASSPDHLGAATSARWTVRASDRARLAPLVGGGPAPPVGDYNFGVFDATVAAAARERIRILPFVWGSPRWVIPNLDRRVRRHCLGYAPRDARAGGVAQFPGRRARRYGTGGTSGPSIPTCRRCRSATGRSGTSRTPTRSSAPGRSPATTPGPASGGPGDPRTRPEGGRHPGRDGGAGRLAKGDSRPAVPGAAVRVKGIERSFDSAAVHPYAAKADQAVAQVRDLRRVMDDAGDRGGGLGHRGGWSSARGGTSLAVGPRGQADRLQEPRAIPLPPRRARPARGALVQLAGLGDGCLRVVRAVGLLTESGRPKPAFRAFRRLAR